MKKIEQFPAKNQNPVLNVGNDGTIFYSNGASEPLLHEWDVKVGEKLPSYIGDFVQRVIYQNNLKKMEIKVGKIVYLLTFYPSSEKECVTIYGFDISDQKKLEGKLQKSEAGEMANLELIDIIDIHVIQSLMNDFYKLSHISMALDDINGKTLVGIGWQDICTKFQRVHPDTCKQCLESNKILSSVIFPGEIKRYKCMNNMWDIVTPIIVNDQHVGNIIAGQFFYEDEPIDYELFRSRARRYGFNEEEYIAALEKVPRLSRDAVDTSMSFLMTFANMVSQLGYSNIKLVKSLAERDALVDTLREIREDFARAQAVGNLGSWRLDVRKNELTWSDETYCIFDIPKGVPLTYEIFLSTIYPNDRKDVDTKWKAELVGESYDVEHRIIADGKIKWVREKAYIEFDNDGLLLGGFGTTQDITECKKAEEALRLSNIYNRSLIETSLDPLVTIGPDGKIMDVNGATEQVTGYSRNELIGTDFSDYFTESKKARKGYQQVFRDGEVRDYPLWIHHKDGHITPVLYNASVYRDENGEVIGVFAAARDITERKKAEAKLKDTLDNLDKLVKERTEELQKAYDSLKQSEKNLDEAQEMAHIGNWKWNIATVKKYWSDEVYRIFGLKPQEFEVTYDMFLSYVHPDDRDYIDNATKEAFKGKPYSIDFRIISVDGKERIAHEQGEVVFDEKNIPIQIKGTIQDITEFKKAEEKIRNLANVVESSNDAIITESLYGIITSWSKGAEEVYGYSAKEILGKPISILEPSTLFEETNKLAELIKQGEKVQQYKTLRLRKDGTIINVSITISPIFDIYGKLTAISVIYRDITESKEAEEKLRESEEKYRNIVETANEGIYIIDDEGIVTYVNKKMVDMLGYNKEESIDRSICDFISEEDKNIIKQKLEKRLKGINESYELKLIGSVAKNHNKDSIE